MEREWPDGGALVARVTSGRAKSDIPVDGVFVQLPSSFVDSGESRLCEGWLGTREETVREDCLAC